MKKSDLTEIGQVAEALYLDQFEKLRPILAREAQIQQQLSRLALQEKDVRETEGQLSDYRAFGADILWRSWEARTRRGLNMELARLRAQKLTAIDGLRRAHGRREAIGDLAARLEQACKSRRAKAQIEDLCTPGLLDRDR
ncbi:hypothetical protein FGK63_13365 [Ruegeria sediminis]|uniref:Flagellar FliJ protein n=1 Tax=Ruegeria sediminis TaxID=2583820 RepID=A0ABY2WXF8_9RHOB|nr:hypothetical protein [Ruegeria sediminis]TMV07096.1 hypothetical protein FGK63_13365 [Ruegeria sediminis]